MAALVELATALLGHLEAMAVLVVPLDQIQVLPAVMVAMVEPVHRTASTAAMAALVVLVAPTAPRVLLVP